MKRLGLDFDNTLVCYDQLFYHPAENCYHGHFLEGCLISVLSQAPSVDEVLVCDDGSTAPGQHRSADFKAG